MTVAELIEKLRTFDPWLPVLIPAKLSDADYESAEKASLQSVLWGVDDDDENGPDSIEEGSRLCVVVEP